MTRVEQYHYDNFIKTYESIYLRKNPGIRCKDSLKLLVELYDLKSDYKYIARLLAKHFANTERSQLVMTAKELLNHLILRRGLKLDIYSKKYGEGYSYCLAIVRTMVFNNEYLKGYLIVARTWIKSSLVNVTRVTSPLLETRVKSMPLLDVPFVIDNEYLDIVTKLRPKLSRAGTSQEYRDNALSEVSISLAIKHKHSVFYTSYITQPTGIVEANTMLSPLSKGNHQGKYSTLYKNSYVVTDDVIDDIYREMAIVLGTPFTTDKTLLASEARLLLTSKTKVFKLGILRWYAISVALALTRILDGATTTQFINHRLVDTIGEHYIQYVKNKVVLLSLDNQTLANSVGRAFDDKYVEVFKAEGEH